MYGSMHLWAPAAEFKSSERVLVFSFSPVPWSLPSRYPRETERIMSHLFAYPEFFSGLNRVNRANQPDVTTRKIWAELPFENDPFRRIWLIRNIKEKIKEAKYELDVFDVVLSY